MCDYFDDDYGDQPDLTLGSLHETDSNYTGTPATDIMPIFPSSPSPICFEDKNREEYYPASKHIKNKLSEIEYTNVKSDDLNKSNYKRENKNVVNESVVKSNEFNPKECYDNTSNINRLTEDIKSAQSNIKLR